MKTLTIMAAMAAATAFADGRTLGANDYSYYRWPGKEGTFAMKTVAATTNIASRQKFWKEVAENTRPVIYQIMFQKQVLHIDRQVWLQFL